MKDLLDRRTWDSPYAMTSWGSLVAALFCSIIFFAAYGGTAWWVRYYDRPDGLIATDQVSFGLFRMCIRGDCIFDMTKRQIINNFVSDDYGFRVAALQALPAAQWLMSFAVFFIMVLFIVYLGFLAGAPTYYAECWVQYIIAILIITSVAVFGSYFNNNSSINLPFGWSYWVAVVAAVLYIFNGSFMLFVGVLVRSKRSLSAIDRQRLVLAKSQVSVA